MTENEQVSAVPETGPETVSAGELPAESPSRPRRSGLRIVILALVLILAGVTVYLLYSGVIFQALIRAMQARNETQKQSIAALSASRDEKDAEILALGREAAEKDAEILALGSELAEKDETLRVLSGENGEKSDQLAELTAKLAAASAPLDYLAALRENPPEAALQALELPESLEQSEETKRSLLSPLLQTAYLEADPEGSREDHASFLIRAADGKLLGSVAFEPDAAADRPAWIAAEERFDFTGCFKTLSVTVPSDYKVYLGDQLLGPEWIREEGIPYQAFSYCAGDYDRLPTMVRYETPPFLGEPGLHVLNEKGQELPAEDLREEVFRNRCSAEVREQIEDFLPGFVELYLLFSADIQESAQLYYSQLKLLVVPDSPLHFRLRDAFEGLGYSAARGAQLKSVTVNCVTDLGDGRYAVDLNYLSMVTGHSSALGPMEDELHLLLILVLTEDGSLLAEALYYL